MEMDTNTSANSIMNTTFPRYIQDLKQSTTLIQDLISSGQKLQSSLKQTAILNSGFCDSFQKLVDHSKTMQVTQGMSQSQSGKL